MAASTLYDYYQSQGQALPSVAARSQIYSQMGLGGGYAGTADQNTRLLAALSSGGTPAPAPAPVQQQAPVQQYQQPAVQQPMGQGGEAELIQAMTQKGHTEQTARAAIAGRGYADLAREYGVGTGSSGIQGLSTQPTFNPVDLYKSLFDSSGISDLEKIISDQEKAYTEAKGKTNENPFLSEATRVGRIAKLEELYNDRTANVKSDIERKKADIEMQLNLQTKLFDIQSQQAQLALSQANNMLQAGMLDNASGEDIANLTRSTGISSTMWQSAINAKKQEGLSTEMQTFDDGVEEGFIVYTFDPMGNIVNQTRQVTGKSSKSNAGTYSTDAGVSDYINKIIQGQQNQNMNISDQWDEPIAGPGLGHYGDYYNR